MFFQDKNFGALQEAATAKGVSEEDFKKFIAYVGGFYSNMSNYHSFGDHKFVPEISQETFHAILDSHPHKQVEGSEYSKFLERVLPLIEHEVFAIGKPYTTLGFPEQGGVTAYFSPQMTSEDLALVKDFMNHHKINPLNTRAFKHPNGIF